MHHNGKVAIPIMSVFTWAQSHQEITSSPGQGSPTENGSDFGPNGSVWHQNFPKPPSSSLNDEASKLAYLRNSQVVLMLLVRSSQNKILLWPHVSWCWGNMKIELHKPVSSATIWESPSLVPGNLVFRLTDSTVAFFFVILTHLPSRGNTIMFVFFFPAAFRTHERFLPSRASPWQFSDTI